MNEQDTKNTLQQIETAMPEMVGRLISFVMHAPTPDESMRAFQLLCAILASAE